MYRWQSFVTARYLEGLAFGLAISAFLFGVSLLVLEFAKDEDWPVLEFGLPFLGVVLVGWLTVRAIRTQIQQQVDNAEKKKAGSPLLAKSRAARALPELSEKAAKVARSCLKLEHPSNDLLSKFDGPMRVVEECIEFADPISAEQLARLSLSIQVLVSRATGSVFDVVAYSEGQDGLDPEGLKTFRKAASAAHEWIWASAAFSRVLSWSRANGGATHLSLAASSDDMWSALRAAGSFASVSEDRNSTVFEVQEILKNQSEKRLRYGFSKCFDVRDPN